MMQSDSDEEDEGESFVDVPEKCGYEEDVPDHLKSIGSESTLIKASSKACQKSLISKSLSTPVPGTSRDWHIFGEPIERQKIDSDPLSYTSNLKSCLGIE